MSYVFIGALASCFVACFIVGMCAGFHSLRSKRPDINEESREKARRSYSSCSTVFYLSLGCLLALIAIDEPVPGESESESLMLSQYIEEGQYQPYYLKYDGELGQYRFCCFDNAGQIIGLTAPIDSRFIPIDPKQDIHVAPYHVDIYSREIKRKFSGLAVTHAVQMVFYIPEDNAYFYDVN